MPGLFNKIAKKIAAATRMAEPLQTLADWGADWTMKPDGSIVVRGNLVAPKCGMTALPDLSHVIVEGDFDCSGNALTWLTGAPQKVGGNFICADNHLVSLSGGPAEVEKNFDCQNNKLASLQGGPARVGGSYECSNNPLKSLAGAPEKASGFYCVNTALESLIGGPREVTGDCWYTAAKLTSLEGAPEKFGHLGTDFGAFDVPADIPVEVCGASALAAAPEETASVPVLETALRIHRAISLVKRNAAA